MRRRFCAWFLMATLVACADGGSSAPVDPGPGTSAGQTSEASPSSDGSEEESAVLEAFEGFRSAVLAQDGEAFAAVVAQPTLEHYEELRDLALSAPRNELAERTLGDQIYAIFLRYLFPPDHLADLDGPEVAAALLEEGAISEGGVQGVRAGEVTISGSDATLQASVEGEEGGFSYTFRREADGWKIDLVELDALADVAYRQQMDQYGLAEDEYVLTAVEAFVGRRPPERIWQPPRR